VSGSMCQPDSSPTQQLWCNRQAIHSVHCSQGQRNWIAGYGPHLGLQPALQPALQLSTTHRTGPAPWRRPPSPSRSRSRGRSGGGWAPGRRRSPARLHKGEERAEAGGSAAAQPQNLFLGSRPGSWPVCADGMLDTSRPSSNARPDHPLKSKVLVAGLSWVATAASAVAM
jgi:hypothetical protein